MTLCAFPTTSGSEYSYHVGRSTGGRILGKFNITKFIPVNIFHSFSSPPVIVCMVSSKRECLYLFDVGAFCHVILVKEQSILHDIVGIVICAICTYFYYKRVVACIIA